MLSAGRIVTQGDSPHEHEREAIRHAIEVLPDQDPYHIWGLCELLEPATGRLYEIDLIVLGYACLYLVEIKSGPGRYQGDMVDWWRNTEEGRSIYMEAPYRLANFKAKVLASRLKKALKGGMRCPWVQPLVFLSHEKTVIDLKPEGRIGVVDRDGLRQALTHHAFEGADPRHARYRVNKPCMEAVARAMQAIGLRKRERRDLVGSYKLEEVVLEGQGYQDRRAVHADQPNLERRARVYLVPEQTSVERRQQLYRAASREAALLYEVREHPNILRFADYVSDAPLGPTVLFDAFESGLPLDAFIRAEPRPTFDERVQILEQVGRALAYCHRKKVFHGNVSPSSVLVRRVPGKGIEAQLFNFQLGRGEGIESTRHWTALAGESASLYMAPELREGASSRDVRTDMFSLGALAYFVLTGQPPATSMAELDQRLENTRYLDPQIAQDTISAEVAEVVREATHLTPSLRIDDADEWVDFLMDQVTRPEPPGTEAADPLSAEKGEMLGGGLMVEGVLGHGATSRVLKVEREGKTYALKVSLSEATDERLQQEAQALAELRHPRIVQIHDKLTIKGRTCLLLSLAGDRPLHNQLAKDGSISLDFAKRYGEDLLDALGHLEEKGQVHRDIKPANLGVGAVTKTANRLTLFDFSLVKTPRGDLQVGTAAYRDPYLKKRGGWDTAADRWSAAITLHEMITGVRPRLADDPDDPRPILAAERFDPAVRDQLAGFFQTALEPDTKSRFPSADDMLQAWREVFREQPDEPGTGVEPISDHGFDREELAKIGPETPIASLPLPALAKNALDRAGLVEAGDLQNLADNRLSGIRGVGTAVARRILEFKETWSHIRQLTVHESKSLLPGYRGEDLELEDAELPDQAVTPLKDAGFHTLANLANAPVDQIHNLGKRHGFELKELRKLLEEENERADERQNPTTLEGWIEALLSTRNRRMNYFRRLFGLDEPFFGRMNVKAAEVAKNAKKTAAAIYVALGKARDEWQDHPAFARLQSMAREIVHDAGGAASLQQAAEELRARLPHDRTVASEVTLQRAAALLRAVSEVDKADPLGIRLLRQQDDSCWLAASEELAHVIRTLGKAADDLAARIPLASPGEAARVLREAALGSPLVNLSDEALLTMAASAARGAARSARLEIYPRGMGAKRALELCAATLHSGLVPNEVQRRVQARYPQAEPLPDRPELDEFMSDVGQVWDEDAGSYTRPGESSRTTLGTKYSSLESYKTALPGQALSMDQRAIRGRRVQDRIDYTLEKKRLLVLGVNATSAQIASRRLAEEIGVKPVSFDEKFLAALHDYAEGNEKFDMEVVHTIDREGKAHPNWKNLVDMAKSFAAQIAEDLLPPTKPLVLVQPGLIGRYELGEFLERLVAASERDESKAIFLLVPWVDEKGVPKINGTLAIPGVGEQQTLWLNRPWLEKYHKAGASG